MVYRYGRVTGAVAYAPVYYGIRDKKKLEKIVEETLKLTGLYEEVAGELHKSA